MRSLRRGASLAVCLTIMAAVLQGQASLARPYSNFILTPYAPTVASGNTEQFSAVGMGDADVQWSATGGTITPTGVFLAGPASGLFTVTATSGERSMTVPVNITERTPSTPRSPMPVVIRPGDSLQDAVRAHAEGTTFLVTRGVHRRQSVRPKDGMTFIGEAGAVLDGEQATAQAFVSRAVNVTIRGLRITRYTPPGSGSTVEGHGTQGWLVEGNEVDHNINGSERVYGIRPGSKWIVRRNIVHHNGWNGINGSGAYDTLIEGNDVYANPPAWFDDTIGEAANIKLYECGRITLRANYVHDGIFKGIWVDTMLDTVTIEHNRVVNHGHAGIWYEVSAPGTIRSNYVENAGYNQTQIRGWLRGGGIEITNSRDVAVTNNTVVNSLNGIIGLQAKSYQSYRDGRSELRNLLVQGNRIVMPRGQTGITENLGSAEVFASWNNRFIGNRFELLDNRSPFAWMGQHIDERQWQSYGQGTNDTFSR